MDSRTAGAEPGEIVEPADQTLRFRAHAPDYVEGFKKDPIVGTLAQILADPWLHGWTDNDLSGHRFDQWMLGAHTRDTGLLMYVADEGQFWWVVGYLSPAPIALLTPWREPPI